MDFAPVCVLEVAHYAPFFFEPPVFFFRLDRTFPIPFEANSSVENVVQFLCTPCVPFLSLESHVVTGPLFTMTSFYCAFLCKLGIKGF